MTAMTARTPRRTSPTRSTLASCVAGALLAASSIAAGHEQGNAAAIGQLMQSWQARILALNLPVDDARNWSRRNAAKFGRLNAERLELAQRANTLDELETLLVDAPLADGARLDVLMANKPGDIAMMGARDVAKSSPATSPAAYAGLVFTALTPCRILDSRISQGGTGPWGAGSSNLIKIGPYPAVSGGYAMGAGAQGGSISGCGLDALAGAGQVAVIMAAVSTVAQSNAGYLTFYPLGAPNPGASSVSQWYQSGYVQTSFVLIPTDLIGTVAASGFSSAGTEVIIDVVGYFAAEAAEAGVTSITAGTGLTGGTITSTGTIAIATAYQLPQTCANGQVPQWNGAGIWSCMAQPSYTAGTGLNLSGSTFAVAGGYQLPQSCTNGQVPQSNGAGVWSCVTPAISGGTVTAVGASAPLASSGGTAPNISLAGIVSVANGGTGQSSLGANAILYGNGTAAVGAAQGVAGEVLTGTAGAPAWTGSPSISGNLTLVNASAAGAGNIMKGSSPFIHNFGTSNAFIGENAGNFAMGGSFNSGLGYHSLQAITTGAANTATGASALENATTGGNNSAIGAFALQANTFGAQNTATGFETLISNTTGNDNTATGVFALVFNTTGSFNTASGMSALNNNTTGNSNIGLGIDAGTNLTTGSFNIAIGNAGVAAESGTTRIGDGNQTRTFISGIRGITTGVANGVAVLIDSNGQLGTVSSSRRYKDDIADMDSASSSLMKLRPVTFHYKTDQAPSGRTLQYGLIAEEVANVYPGLIAHSADGKIETVMYQFLPPMLLNEVQKQKRTIDVQAAHIAGLELELGKMKAQMARVVRLLDR